MDLRMFRQRKWWSFLQELKYISIAKNIGSSFEFRT
jgi:hypothetical protein